MQHIITPDTHNGPQATPSSPVPFTPKSSWSYSNELPSPPNAKRHCTLVGMNSKNSSNHELTNGLWLPLLSPIVGTDCESSILRPRLMSMSSDEGTQEPNDSISSPFLYSSYPHEYPSDTSCPSAAALDDDSFSMSDDSVDASFSELFTTRAILVEGEPREFTSKVSGPASRFTCPLPSMHRSISTRLQPRPTRSSFESDATCFLPLMPMSL